jgi:CRP-like cAMP-binding protein
VNRHSILKERLMTILADRLRDAVAHWIDGLYMPAGIRVINAVVRLAETFGMDIPLAQQDIGSLAGTSRVTVNHLLREEARRGTLRVRRGSISVLDARIRDGFDADLGSEEQTEWFRRFAERRPEVVAALPSG